MPEDIGGSPARILRIGLGALTARQARVRAELLAALARERFEQVRTARMTDGGSTQGETMFGGDTPEITAAEVKGYLKAMQAILSQPAPPTPPHQLPAFAGIRDLVMLNRELARGPDASPLVANNAELLKAQSLARIDETVNILEKAGALGPSPKFQMQAIIAAQAEAASVDGEATAETADHEAADASGDQDDGEAQPAVVPAAAPPALPEPAPEASPETRVQAAAPAMRHSEQPAATVPAKAAPVPWNFAVPASSGPAAPGSPVIIYRDEEGKIIPPFRLDRRSVERNASYLPRLSEVAEEYFDARAIKVGKGNKDLQTARNRLHIFLDLIGDHPVDTYSGSDLQAYIALMTHWPALERHRPAHMTHWEILVSNIDLKFRPLKRAPFENGYVSIAKAVIGWHARTYNYPNPLAGVTLTYPDTAAPAQSAEPLSTEQLSNVFRAGVDGGLLDEAMLPLLGNLTGRRLGLLVHLTGNDIRLKYPGVWVAQTSGIVLTEEGVWKRVPIKTDQSTTFFVLHDLLREIGFIEWAQAQGNAFLFPTLTNLKDPSKQASTYMQRLFRKAGIPGNRREVFHSLRGGHIEMMRDNKVDPRDRRLQAGHKLEEEHDLYGFRAISEKRAREIAHAKLKEEVDYSMFQGLDFEKLAKARRTMGRRPKTRG